MAKYTRQDVKALASFMKDAKKRNKSFVFLTGAGVSSEAGIPLSGEMISRISAQYPYAITQLSEEQRGNYGAVMGSLTPEERRDFLVPILNDSKINWANIALAQIMKFGFIHRLLTLNFDNVLTRACGIIGHYPATYDFGVAPSNNVTHVVEGSIIHLHGQSYGLVMLNSDKETKGHTKKIKRIVKDSLSSHPVCVVGYSGLADNLFSLLTKHYQGHERLFWADYDDPPKHHLEAITSKNFAQWLGGVDADVFLIELAKELECWPPQCFSNPPEHLLAEFKDVKPYPEHFVGQTNYLSDTQTELTEWRDKRAPRHLQELLIAGDYEGVISTANENNKNHKTVLANAYFERAYDLQEEAERSKDTAAYQKAADNYEKAISLRPKFHEAINNWANTLSDLANLTRNEALFQKAFDKYEAALKIKKEDHKALYNWASALDDLAKMNKDVTLFQKAFDKYEAALKYMPNKFQALDNWGGALVALYTLDPKPEHLDEAEPMLLRAEVLSGKASYNLACLYALRGDEVACREKLLACKASGTLPDAAHLMVDDDLAAYRDRDWFTALATQS